MGPANRETGCAQTAPATSFALADSQSSRPRPKILGARRRRVLDAARTRLRAVQSHPTKPLVQPSARRRPSVRGWAETPRHSADRGHSYADKNLQPGRIERPMAVRILMTQTRIPFARRGAIRQREAT